MNILRKKGVGGIWYCSLPAGLNNQSSYPVDSDKLSKQDDQLVHSQNIGQHGQHGHHESTHQTDKDDKSAQEEQHGHVVQGLNIGQDGQLNGQVAWDANATETF